jgi:hypothetical protein
VTLYELWQSESEGSLALLYFPDITNYQLRPPDEQIVWSTHADSYEAAIQAQHDHLRWGSYARPPAPFDYPPPKRTFLFAYDYGQGGIWAFVEAGSAEDVTARYPVLLPISDRPAWLTPAVQRELAQTMHFDIDEPSGWLLELEGRRP